MTASATDVADVFLEGRDEGRSWDTGWEVTKDTYINGRLVYVDHDYYLGYVLEVVERESGVVSYLALAVFHGQRPNGTYERDMIWHPDDCGTFFDRKVHCDQAAVWGVTAIYGMFESKEDRVLADRAAERGMSITEYTEHLRAVLGPGGDHPNPPA